MDSNGDGKEDIITNEVVGNVYAFDGFTKDEPWQTNIYGSEIYTTPAVGQFLEKGKLVVDEIANTGLCPSFFENKNVLIDAMTGKIKYYETFGNFQASSALIVDTDGDGMDEIILSVKKEAADSEKKKYFSNSVMLIDFIKKGEKELLPALPDHNNSSTPWNGDLDGDKMVEIIFCQSTTSGSSYAFEDMRVNLMKKNIPISKPITWDAYMRIGYLGRE